MKSRPVIGITLDWQKDGSFSTAPYYALRDNYCEAIYKAGGLPITIPYIADAIDSYFAQIDGLLSPGGDFALDPSWYVNQDEPMPFESTPRLEFDVAMITRALAQNMPVLGICAGMQIMGGIKGCKLTPNIHKYTDTAINHSSGGLKRLEYIHNISVKEGSFLHSITKKQQFKVNSAHQEAIVSAPDTVTVSAVSPEDGVIEAIELPEYRYAVGVQWHPEFFLNSPESSLLFTSFIDAVNESIRP